MFSAIYRYSTKLKKGEYVKELSLGFPKLKTELKTPTSSFFIVVFVQPDRRKVTHCFWAILHLSQPILKIMS